MTSPSTICSIRRKFNGYSCIFVAVDSNCGGARGGKLQLHNHRWLTSVGLLRACFLWLRPVFHSSNVSVQVIAAILPWWIHSAVPSILGWLAGEAGGRDSGSGTNRSKRDS
jgi:hypothetical protein